jgi:predicted ATPase
MESFKILDTLYQFSSYTESIDLTFNQYVLLNMILEARRKDCQFIISTHSPVLLACPDADIWEIAGGKLERAEYGRLENVRFLRSFLAEPGRYLREPTGEPED